MRIGKKRQEVLSLVGGELGSRGGKVMRGGREKRQLSALEQRESYPPPLREEERKENEALGGEVAIPDQGSCFNRGKERKKPLSTAGGSSVEKGGKLLKARDKSTDRLAHLKKRGSSSLSKKKGGMSFLS